VLLGRGRCPDRRGQWWDRRCVALEKAGGPGAALEAAEAGLADEWVVGGDLLALRRRCLRLRLKASPHSPLPAWADEARWEPPHETLALPARVWSSSQRVAGGTAASVADGAEGPPSSSSTRLVFEGNRTVEEMALEHYAASGWRGWHTEGGVWRALCVLLCWDEIFCEPPPLVDTPESEPEPAALRRLGQKAPLDFGTTGFRARRGPALAAAAARVASLSSGATSDAVAAAWARVGGTAGGLVIGGGEGDATSLDNLCLIARAFAGPTLGAVCRLSLSEWGGGACWGGMPDLVLVKEEDGVVRGRLVEVKSPSDTLSPSQVAWLRELGRAGGDATVLRVVRGEV